MDTFVNWLNREIDARGWNHADMAHRGGISKSMVSRVMSEQSQPGPEFCKAVSRALEINDEIVFRRAGILDPIPVEVEEERAAIHLLRLLDTQVRQAMIATMRNLLGLRSTGQVLNEHSTAYELEPTTLSERLAQQIEHDLAQMTPDERDELIERMLSTRDLLDRGKHHGQSSADVEATA